MLVIFVKLRKFAILKNRFTSCFKIKGVLAEWLGNGLQNHVQRFESARHLQKPQSFRLGFFYLEFLLEYIVFGIYVKILTKVLVIKSSYP